MLEHPGTELQVLIKEKGLTQKAFASILGKKVSEVNELLKGKRNITIQRDYLLHQTLGTPIKYWILKQIDYDYSLLDIEDQKSPPLVRGDTPKELGGFSTQTNHSEHPASHSEHSEESNNHQASHSEPNEIMSDDPEISPLRDGKSHKSSLPGEDLDGAKGDTAKPSEFEQSQEAPVQEPKNKNDEDFKKRARIFKSF